ncbi:hypothetical protein KP509_03G029000 [Ceratopteris richardii]|nr:hypothetical protein KP509_03G029000 [Ceratopteris richardii]
MHEGQVVSAFVTSIEDHGYLVSFGIHGVTGFFRHSDRRGAPTMLRKGQLVQGVINSLDKKRNTVMLNTNPDLVASALVTEVEGLTMELLVPGALVNARVQSVLKNGLLLSFLTYFTGTVNMFHLDDPLPGSDWQQKYSENQRLKARVLFVDSRNKTIGLSLNPHLVQNNPPSIGVNIGELCEKAIVRRVDPTLGLLLGLEMEGGLFAGYAHISDVSDDHIEKLEVKFREGRVVKGRVIGKRVMDGLAVVSLKDSKVRQQLVSCLDVYPGMTVVGEVMSVEQYGAIVKLADGLKAICPLQHMSEFELLKPTAKFKVGKKLKFKVLTCAVDTKKITLTCKKTMVVSKLKPLTAYEEAIEGLVTHGWISGIEDYGCFICFYNNVKGLVHRTELGLDPGVKPESVFQTGQVVKCRILRADPSARRISLSFILSPSRVLELHGDGGKTVSVGDEVSGVVTHVSNSLITLDIPLQFGVARAFMKVELLSDFNGHSEQLRSLLIPGHKFDHLRVLERDDQKLIVTSKFSFLSCDFIPSDISQLNSHKVVPGYIASITEKGCFVRFLGGLTGLASVPQLVDGFVQDPFQHFTVGQSVRAQVLEVNLDFGRFNVSLKQSVCYSTDTNLIKGYFLEEEKIAELQASKADLAKMNSIDSIVVGGVIKGVVQDIKEYGIIVDIQNFKDFVGFVTHFQIDSELKVGDVVTARVLDVVKSDGIIDLTLRRNLVKLGHKSNCEGEKAGRKRRRKVLEIHQKALGVVELIKDEYLVCSLPDYGNAIAFASAHDYNIRVDPHEKYTLGQSIEVVIGALPEDSGVGRLLVLVASFSDPTGGLSVKRRKMLRKLNSEGIIHGQVVSVGPLEMKIKVGKNSVGKVHVTQVVDEFQDENPLARYSVGEMITAKILKKSKHFDDGVSSLCYELTLKPSLLGNEDQEESRNCSDTTLSTLSVGQIVIGYVKDVHDDWALLLISPTVIGRLFVLDSSTDPIQLARFQSRYQIGQPVRCRISKIDYGNGKVDLSLRNLDNSSKDEEASEININDIIGGRVSKILPGVGGLSVQIGAHVFGRVHVTDLHDVWKDNPTRDFKVGQFVRCRVLDVSRNEDGIINQVDLSLRQSLIESQLDAAAPSSSNKRPDSMIVEKLEDLHVDMEVEGFVKNIVSKGCFVTLSRKIDARIKISNLSGTYVADPEIMFPVGKVVRGRVISFDCATGFVELSLRRPLHNQQRDETGLITLKELHVGNLVTGVISHIASYGLFISIDNSKIVGLCHISEVSDNHIGNLESHYKIGERVRAKVLKVEEDRERISLGMKNKYIKDLRMEVESNEEEGLVSEQSLGTNISAETNDADEDRDLGDDSNLHPLSTPVFSVFSSPVEPLDVVLDTEENKLTDDTSIEGVNFATTNEVYESSNKRAKKRSKDLREAAIREAERKLVEGDNVPESIEDFEKLVHVSPNSSFIWIKYMAFLLSLGDADKARAVAERALQTINFREEGEKLNVWVALLNLENVYGDPPKEATMAVFHRALQYCDNKKLYLALLGIYERSDQHDMADELLKTMLRKFKMSCKMWLKRIHHFLRRGLLEAAHKTLDRALLSLPQRKHIKVISQAAIAEFKIGSAEHARNLFESILRNYPKRVDLWSVYLDQEIVLGDATVTRALFERVISLDLPPKKMKFLFKKYLDYEKAHGDEERMDYVKGKAMQYVESRLG